MSKVPVIEGQTVEAGAVLVELESTELFAARQQAEAAVAQAQSRLVQIEKVQRPVAIQLRRQAQATLQTALRQQQRQEALFAQKFIADAALQDAVKASEIADAQARSAELQVLTVQVGGSDWRVLHDALLLAQSQLRAAESRLKYATVRTPRAGVLIRRQVEVGDVVQPGKSLMTLSPSGSMQLVIQIDEKNLGLLALGQTAIASADAFPNTQFSAELVYINPGVDAQTGAVEVKLDVPNPPEILRQNMTVSVEIAVAHRTNAVVVPSSAIMNPSGGYASVLIVQSGRSKRKPIRLGLQSGLYTEVLEGLPEGVAVILSPQMVHEGDRARSMNPSASSGPAPAPTAPS
ncbi:MAG: efflux RND transporter periplasmic adaptor subunit [Betaproteobacteria bacterium]|nr:efflux RND transporter periplasmic adaptor subunit [Betaproteobacteria bacterium]